jgi:hypothetical protein
VKPIYAVLILVLAGACSQHEFPTSAVPPTTTPPVTPGAQPSNAAVAGFVIDADDRNQCIIGARVELVDGPQAGAVFVQTVCGFWDYSTNLGYSFLGLPSGIPVTLRATAKGYKPAEILGVPTNPFQYTTMIVLTKEQ